MDDCTSNPRPPRRGLRDQIPAAKCGSGKREVALIAAHCLKATRAGLASIAPLASNCLPRLGVPIKVAIIAFLAAGFLGTTPTFAADNFAINNATGTFTVLKCTDASGVCTINTLSQPIPGTSNGCVPYHLSGGTAASTNSTSIKATAGNICDLTPINTTATIYYLKLYDSATAPTCSSATNLKHVYPIPASASGAGFQRSIPLGESYTNGIGFCVTGGGGDTDNTNAATGVYIEGSYK